MIRFGADPGLGPPSATPRAASAELLALADDLEGAERWISVEASGRQMNLEIRKG